MKRNASAVWTGDLKQGKGTLTTESGTLKDTPYSFSTRFENGTGTNPEELIGAAHAGCFTMALSAGLGKAGFTPDTLSTQATVTLEQVEGSMTISGIHLETVAQVPGIQKAQFDTIAAETKTQCIVSRVLNTKITLNATLK